MKKGMLSFILFSIHTSNLQTLPKSSPHRWSKSMWLPTRRLQKGYNVEVTVAAPSKSWSKVCTWKIEDLPESLPTNTSKEVLDIRRCRRCWPDTMIWLGFRPKLCPMLTRRRRAKWPATLTAVVGSDKGEHLGPSRPNRRSRHESRDTLLRLPANRQWLVRPRSLHWDVEGGQATYSSRQPPLSPQYWWTCKESDAC
jgi:hypothetical protein